MSGYGLSQQDAKYAAIQNEAYSPNSGYANAAVPPPQKQHAMAEICNQLDNALQIADKINKNLEGFFIRLKGEPAMDQKQESVPIVGPSLPGVDQRLSFLQTALNEISHQVYELHNVA